MSESPTTPGSTPPDEDAGHRASGVFRALAWVGIIAGVVFTVAVIFFSGYLLGRASDGHKGWQRGYHSAQLGQGPAQLGQGPAQFGQGPAQFGQGPGGCPMMRQGSTMGPQDMGPRDMGPGDMRPGMMQPGQPTPRPSPAVPGPPPQR